MSQVSIDEPAVQRPLRSPTTLLRSRRAALTFAVMVFLTTVVQVLAVPLTALVEGATEWGLVFSEPVILSLLVAGCAAQSAALLLSDRWPKLAVIAVTTVYLVMALGLAVPSWLVGMYLVIALAMFLLATRSAPAVSILWAVGVSLISIALLYWWVLAIGTPPQVATGFVLAEAARLAVPTFGGTALGIWWAAQVRRVTTVREAAELAKQEHEERVEDARSRERARIAQELHDVAGQHLAGLITLSDAALAIAPTQPEHAIELVQDVRNEGRFAAASLAGALADLRATGAERLEITRDLQRAPELVDYWQRRGMQVRLTVKGVLSDLPAVVSTTAYRSLQEALTNAAKHAPGAPVNVDIALTSDHLDMTVENGPPLHTHSVPGLDLGWGLASIRERLDLLGGSLSASGTATGGWRLVLEVPTLAVV